MKQAKQTTLKALGMLAAFTLLCGVLYTAAVTLFGQAFFSSSANGSIVTVDGKEYGSALLGQQYTGNTHLWGRIMILDTETFTTSGGEAVMYAQPSTISPASEEYRQAVAQRVEKIKKAHLEMGDTPIPADLVTVSGSGLDPHISPAAAEYQVRRLAKNTGKTEQEVRDLIARYTEGRFLGVFGEERVNVLKVNLALDGILH